jgi:cytochrome d ubiquinol oxidase subunit I
MFEFDPILLARIQFAFVISFHIIFPAFTIGLSAWLAVIEWRWLKTRNIVYKELYQMWIKIFAICFGIGVVTGVVMSYQFGTNWSLFSDKVGNVIGPLLAYEVLTAFFLEASFLGIMLFGWGRVSEKMHFASSCIVAIGTLISSFWILSANSWMQTPQGFEIIDGIFYPTSWMEIVFNPSFPYRLTHMVIATYLTTAFVVAGIGAFYLWKNIYQKHAKVMLAMAMIMVVILTPLQIFIGDLHGLNTLEHQPRKVAAMEGIWENEQGAALRLFAIPDQENQKNNYEVKIPKLASLILTHKADGEIKGLKSWDKKDQPPVLIVFWSFRVMVGIGILMLLTGLIAILLFFKKRLFNTKWFQYWCMAMIPSGFVALLAGWFVTEVGRQPYTVYGLLRTDNSASPIISEQIAISLAAFIVVYLFMFISATYYILKLIKKGPKKLENEDNISHNIEESLVKSLTKK